MQPWLRLGTLPTSEPRKLLETRSRCRPHDLRAGCLGYKAEEDTLVTPGALAAEGTLARSHRLPGSLRLCVSQEALGDARVNARVRLPPGGVGTRAKTQRGDSMGRAPGEQRGVAGGGGRRAGLGTGPARGVAWCGIGWAGRGRAASTSPEEVCPEPSSPSEPRSQLSGLPRHPPLTCSAGALRAGGFCTAVERGLRQPQGRVRGRMLGRGAWLSSCILQPSGTEQLLEFPATICIQMKVI